MAQQAFTTTRIGISTNLPLGGTYDLLYVTTPNFPVGNLQFRFETTPRKITGIQKVAQLFLKVLFTQKGSEVVYTNHGTDFPNLLVGANRQGTDPEFMSAVKTTIQDAESQVKYIFNGADGDPASTLTSVAILGFDTSIPGSLSIFLQLITAAGEMASIAVPFPQLDMKLSS